MGGSRSPVALFGRYKIHYAWGLSVASWWSPHAKAPHPNKHLHNSMKLPSLQKKGLFCKSARSSKKRYTHSTKCIWIPLYPTHVGWFAIFQFALVLRQFACVLQHFVGFQLWPKKTSVFNILKKCSFHLKKKKETKRYGTPKRAHFLGSPEKKVLRLKVQVKVNDQVISEHHIWMVAEQSR